MDCLFDSREQGHHYGLDKFGFRMSEANLVTGDMTLRGFENDVCVERKTEGDFIACCGGERSRFERELLRMRPYRSKCVLVESCWPKLEVGGWRGKVVPPVPIHSIVSWSAEYGIPFFLVGDRERGERFAARFLYSFAKHRYAEFRALVANARPEAQS